MASTKAGSESIQGSIAASLSQKDLTISPTVNDGEDTLLSLISLMTLNHQPKPTLTTLPDEILLNILTRACAHDAPIVPQQHASRSSQFVHALGTRNSPYHKSIFAKPVRNAGRLPCALTAVELSLTCKKLRQIVIGEILLQKYNSFEFQRTKMMLKYLVAISPDQRNVIKSIRFTRDYGRDPSAALKILSTCQGLERLEFDITMMSAYFQDSDRAKGFKKVAGYTELMKLRGVEVKLIYHDDSQHQWDFIAKVLVLRCERSRDEEIKEALRREVQALQDSINASTMLPRSGEPTYTEEELQRAADEAKLYPRVFQSGLGSVSVSVAATSQKITATTEMLEVL